MSFIKVYCGKVILVFTAYVYIVIRSDNPLINIVPVSPPHPDSTYKFVCFRVLVRHWTWWLRYRRHPALLCLLLVSFYSKRSCLISNFCIHSFINLFKKVCLVKGMDWMYRCANKICYLLSIFILKVMLISCKLSEQPIRRVG